MGDNEINLTYETLFELVRREKNRAELQKLEKSFSNDFVTYLGRKKELLDKQRTSDFLSHGEKQKIEQEVYNIKRLLKELYDRREKKIVEMAIVKARTGSKIIEQNLADEEKPLFDSLNDVFSRYRSQILEQMMQGNFSKTKGLKSEANDADISEKDLNQGILDKKAQNKPNNTKMVEFLAFVPEFVGLDLEDYGPFNENDVVELPGQIAAVLVENKVAKITESDE